MDLLYLLIPVGMKLQYLVVDDADHKLRVGMVGTQQSPSCKIAGLGK